MLFVQSYMETQKLLELNNVMIGIKLILMAVIWEIINVRIHVKLANKEFVKFVSRVTTI